MNGHRKFTSDEIWNMTQAYIKTFRCNTNRCWQPDDESQKVTKELLEQWKMKKSRLWLTYQMGVHPFHPDQRKITQQLRKEISDCIYTNCNRIRLDEASFQNYSWKTRTRMITKCCKYMRTRTGWSSDFIETIIKTINSDCLSNKQKYSKLSRDNNVSSATKEARQAKREAKKGRNKDIDALKASREHTIRNQTNKKDLAQVEERFTKRKAVEDDEFAEDEESDDDQIQNVQKQQHRPVKRSKKVKLSQNTRTVSTPTSVLYSELCSFSIF